MGPTCDIIRSSKHASVVTALREWIKEDEAAFRLLYCYGLIQE